MAQATADAKELWEAVRLPTPAPANDAVTMDLVMHQKMAKAIIIGAIDDEHAMQVYQFDHL